jgi:tRNA_anti-like
MKKKKNLKRSLLLLAVIVTITALYAYKEYNRKNKNLHDAEAAFTLKSTELISLFSNDEKKANAAYSGKTILVTGNVRAADKDERGFFTVVLGDTVSMSSVRCSVDSSESSKAAMLQPNSVLKIKGICTGYIADDMGVGADVILNRCVIDSDK